jgi:hypothetical protein
MGYGKHARLGWSGKCDMPVKGPCEVSEFYLQSTLVQKLSATCFYGSRVSMVRRGFFCVGGGILEKKLFRMKFHIYPNPSQNPTP